MALRLAHEPPLRSAPFTEEPGFYPDAGLWMYRNVRLLGAALASVSLALGRPHQTPFELQRETEQAALVARS